MGEEVWMVLRGRGRLLSGLWSRHDSSGRGFVVREGPEERRLPDKRDGPWGDKEGEGRVRTRKNFQARFTGKEVVLGKGVMSVLSR